MSAKIIRQYMQLLQQNIDRASLVTIATKLKITGYTNKFRRPYIKKNVLKTIILKDLKKRNNKRSSSVSSLSRRGGGCRRSRRRAHSAGAISSSTSPLSPDHYKVYRNNTLRLPVAKRLIAIGDIHGDMRAIVRALKVANVIPLYIPENNSIDVQQVPWIGGDTVVVQLGDQIDRARPTSWCNDCIDEEIEDDEGSDLAIMNLLDNLHKKAIKKGGAVISVLGNHELMNALGDFRYVSLKEFEEFGLALSGKQHQHQHNETLPFGHDERKKVFSPGGIMAKRMANTRYCVVQVGSWIFVHGGITPKIALKYSIDHLNYITKEWLRGNHSKKIVEGFQDIFENDDDDMSPYWTRMFSDFDEWDENRMKYLFDTMLKILNANNKHNPINGMIVGHSPQYMYGKCLNSSFNHRLWRVDVGMSRAFGPLQMEHQCRKIQVLEIKNDNQFTILTE